MNVIDQAMYYAVGKGKPDAVEPLKRYPFRFLKVGDWFEAPRDKTRSLRVRASLYGKQHGRVYTVRIVDTERVRCTRLA